MSAVEHSSERHPLFKPDVARGARTVSETDAPYLNLIEAIFDRIDATPAMAPWDRVKWAKANLPVTYALLAFHTRWEYLDGSD